MSPEASEPPAGGSGANTASLVDASVELPPNNPDPVQPDPPPVDAGTLPGAPSALDAGADADAAPAVPNPYVDAGHLPDAADLALAERLQALSARLAPLGARTSSFWFTRGPDAQFGGFHGTLDRAGNPIAPEDKGLIQQVRHLWTLSLWYERREASTAVRALAASTYAFVRRSFLDTTDGAFVFKVSRDGTRIVDGKKQLFAESFALYALATYGRVFGVAEAVELALARFSSIDRRHDQSFGGYDQTGDPGFMSAGAEKDTNTHLHLMEAFTALYEATADARVASRLSELVDLFANTLRQPSGYIPAEYERDWTPFGAASVSYGHDLETSWLMLEAARVLGRQNEASVRSAALAIAEHSARRGFDATLGGYFELGVPAGAVTDRDKIWWVQFEALSGLWWAYASSRDEVYLERLSATLAWIEAVEDRPRGEWFATTNPDGTASGADYKGDEWKESYHPVRALVYLQDWIDAEVTALLRRR